MIIHKRPLAAIVAITALAVMAMTFAAPGSAAAPYVPGPSLTVNTTAPPCGGPIIKSGTGFVPGSTVVLSLVTPSRTFQLGTVVVRADGSFTAHEVLPPGVSGTARNRAAGPPTATNPNAAEVTITIGPCVTAPVTPPPSPAAPPSKPSLAFTGVQIFGMVALVVVLVAIGGGLVYLGRRRKGAA